MRLVPYWPIPGTAALSLLASLAACGGGSLSDAFPPACPRAAILSDAGSIIRYRPQAPPGGQDLTDMTLEGRIIGVSGKCERESRTKLGVTISARMRLARGPAAQGRTVEVPYFVAVTEGQRILDKQVATVRADFPRNADQVRLSTDETHLTLPISREKSGSAYDVLVGFQLTPEELARNRQRGG